MTTPPWFKMHREERGSFAQLPLMARALFGEVLKLTDDDGRIGLGGKTPADAVAFALGATRSDRRALRKYIPMLLEDGCLVVDGDSLVAPGWDRFQAGSTTRKPSPKPSPKPPSRPQPDPEPDATEPRPNHDGATNEPRTNHDDGSNHAESLGADPQIREEKRREEEHTQSARDVARFADPLEEREHVTAGAFATRLFVMAMRDLSDPCFSEMRITGNDRERLAQMVSWATTVANDHAKHGENWQEVYAQALAGSLDAWCEQARKKPDSVPLNPGGWWARRDQWRRAS